MRKNDQMKHLVTEHLIQEEYFFKLIKPEYFPFFLSVSKKGNEEEKEEWPSKKKKLSQFFLKTFCFCGKLKKVSEKHRLI